MPAENLYPKPARLSWEEAAAFPLAALTAYRALFARGGSTSDESVLVLGAGSGVSTFAVQLAAQAGARVLVTSSSQEKIDRAVELGAEGGVLYTEGDWAEAVGGDGRPRRRPRARLGRLDLARLRSRAARAAGGSSSSAARAAPR